MASDDHTRTLLQGAGFQAVETEEIRMRFVHRDLAGYMSWTVNAAGALALVLRELSEDERDRIAAEVEEAFTPFVTRGGYELPAVTLNAVAS